MLVSIRKKHHIRDECIPSTYKLKVVKKINHVHLSDSQFLLSLLLSLQAVCCADMEHCCASGYTCGEEGSCTQSLGLSWDDWRMVFTNRKRAL